MDDLLMHVSANWMAYAASAVVAFLGWYYRGNLGGLVGGAGGPAKSVGDNTMGTHVVNLFAIRGLLSEAANVEAVNSIDELVLPGLGKAPDAIRASKAKLATEAAKAAKTTA